MDSGEKAALLSLKGDALTDIDVRDIEDSLMSSGLLTVADKERIHTGSGTRQQETSTLMDIILEKNRPNTFGVFLESVKEPYQHVWRKLVDVRKSPESALSHSSSETIFIEGGVPIAPRGNVELEFMSLLKEALVALSQRPDGGWVVIWGQGGSGKSVMAAQAVRGACQCGKAIAAYFYNKVFWFTIGKLPKEQLRFEASLLVKMQNIIRRLNASSGGSYQPPAVSNLEAARDLLRSTLVKQYPVCLIVLDDVWDSRVAKYFDVQSRVLVTTRSKDILGRIQRGKRGRCRLVNVNKGFTEAASINLLRELVLPHEGTAVALSPESASNFKTIHSECGGSPFVVSIFGSLLRSGMAKFEYFIRRYKDNLFGRTELESGDYDYTNIMEAIMVSIEDLDEKDKSLFLRLSIFTSSNYLSPAVLSAYCWTHLDEDEAQDKMEDFVRRSLATEEQTPAGLHLFTLHDLIVSVLRAKYKNETVEYNDQFVACVLQSRQEHSSWHDLEDDCEYLAYNFIYHLVNVHERQMSLKDKQELLLDFDFICWLSCRIGPDSLVFAYRFAVKFLKLSEPCQQMLKFLRSPVFRIQSLCLAGGGQSAPAVIQLALSCADGDSLLQHVREAALDHRHSTCFYEWVNRSQTEEQITDTLEVGCNATSFSLNGAKTHAAVASDYSVSIKDLKARRTIYRCLDKKFKNDRVVAVSFSLDNDSLWLLTTTRLIKYFLPQGTLDSATDATSPSVGSIQQQRRYSLVFPTERPRSYSNEVQSLEGPSAEELLVWQDDTRPDTEFTALCLCSDQRLVVGSREGRIYELTVTGTFINCCYDYQIDKLAVSENCISHVASNLTSLAVSGPDCCVHVYEGRPNDCLESSSVRKYTGFQEQGRPPVKSLFDPLPGVRFVASISGNEIHLWHPVSLKTLVIEQGQNNAEFTSLALSNDGVFLAASTSRAHIYLYRLRVTDDLRASCELELVDEFNGTGTRARCLTFGSDCLYSLSEVSNESVLTKWRAVAHNASPCFRRPMNRQSSIFFGNECCTLRLRTAYDAVSTSRDRILVACQSVRRSLLILESTGASFRHIAKYKGEGAQLKKALAVGMSPDGRCAVFTFDGYVVTAAVAAGGSWQFTCRPEAVSIRELVMLPSCRGFIGSDKEKTLVFYGNSCTEQTHCRLTEHTRLLPLPSNATATFPDARAVVLTSHSWHFVTDSLARLSNAVGSISLAENVDSGCDVSLCCLDVSNDGLIVAGGLSDGSLRIWMRLGVPGSFVISSCTRRPDSQAALRCVRFSPGCGGRLLAGAFDDGSFALWRLRSTPAAGGDGLLDCHPLLPPTSVGAAGSESSSVPNSLAWSVTASAAAGSWGDARPSYRLILAATDCVWLLCCLSEQDVSGGADGADASLDVERCLSRVPLYSRQGVAKALVLGPDGDLLYVDHAHTVFWMRNLQQCAMQQQQHRRGSAP